MGVGGTKKQHKWHEMGSKSTHVYLSCTGRGTHNFILLFNIMLHALDKLVNLHEEKLQGYVVS